MEVEANIIQSLRDLENALKIDYENLDSGLDLPYVSKKELGKLTKSQKNIFSQKNAELSLRIVKLIALIITWRIPKAGVTLHDITLDTNLSHPFTSLTLWDKITKYNLSSIYAINKLLKHMQSKEKK